ncbi:MAG TPA: NAD-dependent epimerase/dehydratase family protein [Candidatus Saccharimonadales bacterium]|nr:NAD-dependent epimerase/dehydratase family protein [Candidatus Saccharimonadales bacterium]
MTTNTLVLGANGFIGSHLVDSLAKKGYNVRAFDRFSSGNVIFNQYDNIEMFPGNYLNTDDLKNALKDIDYVFHFISTTTPASAENDPIIDIDTNIRMSVELFRMCVELGVKRVIFASTGGAIYGNSNGDEPHKEEDTPFPVSPYAIGKLTIEHYLRYFRVKHKLDSVTFRISNPYGERQPFHRKQGVIPIFLENIYRELPINVMGDGSMVRDYIYVKDLTDMITDVFEKPLMNHTYNLGSGEGKSVNDIVDAIEQVLHKKALIKHSETPSTFLPKVILDTSRFVSEFSETPVTSLHEGVAATYNYIKQEIDRGTANE